MKTKIFEFVNLHQGEEEKQKVLDNVITNISFRGSNLWILACAIIIASVGLNVNSTAVIIGAMLISPLMGPIVGAGFALGTFNIDLLRRSFKNLLIATVVSLTVSTLYFSISPFKETQSELLARTSPNIYDVLIAFFGGLVGVIAITRVEKGNPIPGVAIATALMPPLCTAGYGLAIGNIPYFLGAFYLYTINCFFICIATFGIVKYLKYPALTIPDPLQQKRIHYAIYIVIALMIIPSSYLAYKLFQERKFNQQIHNFIVNEFPRDEYTIVYQHLNTQSEPRQLELAFLSKRFDTHEIRLLQERLKRYRIENTNLIIRQDSLDLKKEIIEELNQNYHTETGKDLRIYQLEQQLKNSRKELAEIAHEIGIIYPQLHQITVGEHFNANDSAATSSIVMIYKASQDLSTNESHILEKWLQLKTKNKHILLLRNE